VLYFSYRRKLIVVLITCEEGFAWRAKLGKLPLPE
jgi:hypothetical protein